MGGRSAVAVGEDGSCGKKGQQPVKLVSFLALRARNDRRFLIKKGEVTLGPSHGRVGWPFHHRLCEGPSVIPLLSYTAPVIPSPQGEETPLPLCAYRYDGCEPNKPWASPMPYEIRLVFLPTLGLSEAAKKP